MTPFPPIFHPKRELHMIFYQLNQNHDTMCKLELCLLPTPLYWNSSTYQDWSFNISRDYLHQQLISEHPCHHSSYPHSCVLQQPDHCAEWLGLSLTAAQRSPSQSLILSYWSKKIDCNMQTYIIKSVQIYQSQIKWLFSAIQFICNRKLQSKHQFHPGQKTEVTEMLHIWQFLPHFFFT